MKNNILDIYFAASITGGREDSHIYSQLIDHLKTYGNVLTEHIGNLNLTEKGEQLSPKEIHDRDLEWLLKSDVVIAETTKPSFGVGYEIGVAVENDKKVFCLYRQEKLSSMLTGSSGVVSEKYSTIEDGKEAIDIFLSEFYK